MFKMNESSLSTPALQDTDTTARRGVCLLLVLLSLQVATPGPGQVPGAPESATPIAVEGPAFVALRVADVEAAAVWYAHVFGLESKKSLNGEANAFSIRILGNDRVTVELIEQNGTAPPPERHHGLFKVGFYVDDVTRTLGRLRALGVVSPNEDVTVFVDEPLSVRSFLIRDLEGNRLQFFERCGETC